MWVCSATNSDSNPASSAARATSRTSLVRSVANNATPRCMSTATESEGDDLADDVPRRQRTERVVDVIEGQPPGDHALEVEPTRAPQREQPREVAADVGGPVVGATQVLLVVKEIER